MNIKIPQLLLLIETDPLKVSNIVIIPLIQELGRQDQIFSRKDIGFWNS